MSYAATSIGCFPSQIIIKSSFDNIHGVMSLSGESKKSFIRVEELFNLIRSLIPSGGQSNDLMKYLY
jgi:hypothetical protein